LVIPDNRRQSIQLLKLQKGFKLAVKTAVDVKIVT
jgi:hypothetical protein